MNKFSIKAKLLFILLSALTLFAYTACGSDSGSDDPNVYTVKFESNGGSEVKSLSVEEGKSAVRPADPSKEGFVFEGWFTDSELASAYDFATKVTKNITLYAKWTSVAGKYKITFETNGGTQVSTQAVTEGKATIPTAPTKEHYTFENWYSDESLTTVFDFESEITSDITLYAKWTPVKYTVSFDTNGGSEIKALSVDYNTKATAPTAPTKEHYVFDKWYSDKNLSVEFSFDTAITGNITLYAGWNLAKYTVTFDTNGGKPIESKSVEYNSCATEPSAPEKENNVFMGWYTDSACTSEYDFSKAVTGDITLYAKWAAKDTTWTVTFETNGGKAIESKNVEKGKTVTKPADPIKEGYKFLGWYVDEELTTEFDFTSTVEDNITLWAKWLSAITVKFEKNDGTEVTEETIEKGTKLSKPADPTRTGYKFKGWYTDSQFSTAYDFSSILNDNITLYAKWVQLFTVSFSEAGIDSQTVEANQKATKPADPVSSTGLLFGGWYTSENFTTKYDFNTAVTRDIKLYAKWSDEWTVTFSGATGVPAQTVKNNQKATKPTNPEDTNGLGFAGWYADAAYKEEFDFNTPITTDTTIYAKWLQKFTVTFNSMNGSKVDPVKVVSGKKVTKPADPTRDGRAFLGWYKDKNLKEKFDFDTPIIKAITLYAKWEMPENALTLTVTNADLDVICERNSQIGFTEYKLTCQNGDADWYVNNKKVSTGSSYSFNTKYPPYGVYTVCPVECRKEINGIVYSWTALFGINL